VKQKKHIELALITSGFYTLVVYWSKVGIS